jgi:hypothetical protein
VQNVPDGPAVQRTGDSAAAGISVHGTSGEELASEANEAVAKGSEADAPGAPLALGAGAAAAAEAAKDLAGSLLGKAAQEQRGSVQARRLAGNMLGKAAQEKHGSVHDVPGGPATQRMGDSADKAAAEGSAHGALSEKKAPEANERVARGSG